MEIWKKISKESNYEVSDHGNVRREIGMVKNNVKGYVRKVGGKNLSQKTKSNGYKEVHIYENTMVGKSVYVHRLVAMAFLGSINEGYSVNHKDGNKANNHYLNLEIVTHSENSKHSYHALGNKNISSYKGSSHGMSKLNEEQVLLIRELYTMGKTPTELSKQFVTPFSTICKVCYNQTWKHL